MLFVKCDRVSRCYVYQILLKVSLHGIIPTNTDLAFLALFQLILILAPSLNLHTGNK
jgi:hypothetical protein